MGSAPGQSDALAHGAVGHVVKDTPAAELASTVRIAARRATHLRIVRPEV
ncbi:MAG: hypothetical protein QOJ21_3386 [Solirubrobacteraceae bacterium]|nr:hypothetical protein [Solirubrobacteraceae bacterium]